MIELIITLTLILLSPLILILTILLNIYKEEIWEEVLVRKEVEK